MTITNTGNVDIADGNLVVASGHGIDFAATSNSSGSMSSELLDDYEEGTWTPVPKADTTTISHNISRARYIKIGSSVTISATINFDEDTPSGFLSVQGLPFTSSTNVENHGACMLNDFHFNNTYQTICTYMYPSNSKVEFYGTRDSADWVALHGGEIRDDSSVQFTMTYFVA